VTHDEWIAGYVARHSDFVRGRCAEATIEMIGVFPTLRRVAGLARWVAPHGRAIIDEHWWLVDEAGDIVDPTRAQFGGAHVEYEPIDLDDPASLAKVPTGKCMECGGYAYAGAAFCAPACERAYVEAEGAI
jgi:hypothetical protein